MLKLIHAFNMNFENVLEYYNSFAVNKYKDINNYAIRLVKEGKEKYYDYITTHEKIEVIYYLVDSSNENYIIGFGSIEDSKILDYHEEYLNIGNIGYGVRPNERNNGYGTRILELLLLKCEEKGMSEVCVSCEKGNIASQKIIIKNNGIFEKEFYDDFEGAGLKYWIKLKPKLSNKIHRLVKMYSYK